jgi:hypothetical protein
VHLGTLKADDVHPLRRWWWCHSRRTPPATVRIAPRRATARLDQVSQSPQQAVFAQIFHPWADAWMQLERLTAEQYTRYPRRAIGISVHAPRSGPRATTWQPHVSVDTDEVLLHAPLLHLYHSAVGSTTSTVWLGQPPLPRSYVGRVTASELFHPGSCHTGSKPPSALRLSNHEAHRRVDRDRHRPTR